MYHILVWFDNHQPTEEQVPHVIGIWETFTESRMALDMLYNMIAFPALPEAYVPVHYP